MQSKMCENHLHFDYVRLAWDSGFCFEESKMKTAFDVSTIILVDLEKVTRDRDIATVERHIPTIIQFPLDEELTKILEPTFVKVFKLCQLALQYMRFCNKYLDNTVVILKKELVTCNEDINNLQKVVNHLKTENDNLHTKNKDLIETLHTINQTATFKCAECPKFFYSEDYLKAHIQKRHDSQSLQIQTEAEKLQLEIKQLKERLNSTEKLIQNEKVTEKHTIEPNNDSIIVSKTEALQAKFEQLKEHIEGELSVLRDEGFYRNIYEKWFEEMYLKLKNQSPRKTYIEQGSGDCVRLTESGTQTQLEEVIMQPISPPKPKPRKINEININDLEMKLVKSVDSQREVFEQILEQKLTGSMEKIELQMNTFWNKLSTLEQQQTVPQVNYYPQPSYYYPPSTPTHHKIIVTKPPVQNLSDSDSDTDLDIEIRKPKPVSVSNLPVKPKLYNTVQVVTEPLIVASKLTQVSSSHSTLPRAVKASNRPKSSHSLTSSAVSKGRNIKRSRDDSDLSLSRVESNERVPIYESNSIKSSYNSHQFRTQASKAQADSSESETSEESIEDEMPPPKVAIVQVVAKPAETIEPATADSRKENTHKTQKHESKISKAFSLRVKTNPSKTDKPERLKSRISIPDIFSVKSKFSKSSLEKASKPKNSHKKPKNSHKKSESSHKKKDEVGLSEISEDSNEDEGTQKMLDDRLLHAMREEIQATVDLKLKDIGVAPQWNGIPLKTFKHAVGVVEHQASLAKKRIPNYSKIRAGILRVLEKRVKKEAASLKANESMYKITEPSNPESQRLETESLNEDDSYSEENRSDVSTTTIAKFQISKSEDDDDESVSILQATSVMNEKETISQVKHVNQSAASKDRDILQVMTRRNDEASTSGMVHPMQNTNLVKTFNDGETDRSRLADVTSLSTDAASKVVVSANRQFANTQAGKKKVLFDLMNSDDSAGNIPEQVDDVSSSFISSSVVLDGTDKRRVGRTEKGDKRVKDNNDASDWDISDIN